MEWTQIPLGPIQTNCYILRKQNTCLIVDPGAEGEKLVQFLGNHHINPVGIVLTHAHFDHIGAADIVRDTYKIPMYVHENESDWLTSAELNGSEFFKLGKILVKKAEYTFSGDQEYSIGDFNFRILETPGHSPGSISMYFKDSDIVISGDALFNGSIGRTDLQGGNHEQLLTSIHSKLLPLPENTLVLPGHGPITSIENEMGSNPFLHGFSL